MNPVLSLVVAISATTWAYTKLNKRTGYGNTASIIPSLVAIFIITGIIAYTLFQFVFHLS